MACKHIFSFGKTSRLGSRLSLRQVERWCCRFVAEKMGDYEAGNNGEAAGNRIRTRSTMSELSEAGELLRFAVPKKGRLYEKVTKILEGIGLQFMRAQRLDIAYCENMPVLVVFLPAGDIASFVGRGNVDLGITGQDIVAESNVDVRELAKLGFGKCRLAVQAPVVNHIKSPKELAGMRICTSFPRLTKEYFHKLDPSKETPVTYVQGSVEAACGLGLADAVVDLVETGTTMRAAGLEIVDVVMNTEAVLIANQHSKFPGLVEKIRKRIEGYLLANKYKMIYYNIERSKLERAKQITPGRRAPSVTSLEEEAWISVGAMVLKKDVSDIMDKLQEIGALDIFVVDIANCRA